MEEHREDDDIYQDNRIQSHRSTDACKGIKFNWKPLLVKSTIQDTDRKPILSLEQSKGLISRMISNKTLQSTGGGSSTKDLHRDKIRHASADSQNVSYTLRNTSKDLNDTNEVRVRSYSNDSNTSSYHFADISSPHHQDVVNRNDEMTVKDCLVDVNDDMSFNTKAYFCRSSALEALYRDIHQRKWLSEMKNCLFYWDNLIREMDTYCNPNTRESHTKLSIDKFNLQVTIRPLPTRLIKISNEKLSNDTINDNNDRDDIMTLVVKEIKDSRIKSSSSIEKNMKTFLNYGRDKNISFSSSSSLIELVESNVPNEESSTSPKTISHDIYTETGYIAFIPLITNTTAVQNSTFLAVIATRQRIVNDQKDDDNNQTDMDNNEALIFRDCDGKNNDENISFENDNDVSKPID
jgi:hypothetical protein